jgi:hypothetical protein
MSLAPIFFDKNTETIWRHIYRKGRPVASEINKITFYCSTDTIHTFILTITVMKVFFLGQSRTFLRFRPFPNNPGTRYVKLRSLIRFQTLLWQQTKHWRVCQSIVFCQIDIKPGPLIMTGFIVRFLNDSFFPKSSLRLLLRGNGKTRKSPDQETHVMCWFKPYVTAIWRGISRENGNRIVKL